MKDKDILFWHLTDLKGLDIFQIADKLGLKAGYIDNVRVGRKPINGKFRLNVARTWPELTDFMVHGMPPELPECKALFVRIWYLTGDGLEAIALKTDYKIGYIRRLFSGAIRLTDEFKKAAMGSYPGIPEAKIGGLTSSFEKLLDSAREGD